MNFSFPNFVKGSQARTFALILGIILFLVGAAFVVTFKSIVDGLVTGFGFVVAWLSIRA